MILVFVVLVLSWVGIDGTGGFDSPARAVLKSSKTKSRLAGSCFVCRNHVNVELELGRDNDDWLMGGQLTYFPRRKSK